MVQIVDLVAMSESIERELIPAMLLLDASHPGCHRCDWLPVAGLTPATHRGYALQWFSLGAALVLLCAWAYRRRTRDGN